MDRMHSDKSLEERRALRAPRYADTLDHRFEGTEQADYDSLRAQGRSYYDDLRWFEGATHEQAMRDALHSYGRKTPLR